ncbi:MAG: T9SS type A sorting domain-containing protein [Paludibacter sp.]|nr:T9SS type A sorting domain-containing protein [Paludibacter sp.]
MKKISLSILVLSLVMTVNAQVDGFFPQFGQDAQWSVNEQFELVFTGVIAPAPNAAIATTFEGLVSDGIGGNDFTGVDIKFDAFIFDQPTNTQFLLGYDGTWGGKGVILEFNQWLCQATVDFSYAPEVTKWLITTPSTYQAAIVKNGYNTIEVNVSATGLISCKVNGYVCDVPYQAPLATLKPTAIATYYSVWTNGFTNWKMKNLSITKGDVTNKYFSDPAAGVDQVSQENTRVYPNPTKGSVTLSNESVGQSYQITNVLGQEIQKGIINSNTQLLNLKNENAGTYFISIQGKNGKIVKSIIKN